MSYTFTQSFPYLLNRVGVRQGELFGRRLSAFGVTLPMYRVMAVLRQQGEQGLSELSAMTSIELSTLSRLVTTMKKAELISRVRPETNGRTVEISLTAKGTTLVDQLMPVAADFESVGTRSFTEEEVAWLKAALVRIYDNLETLESDPKDRGP